MRRKGHLHIHFLNVCVLYLMTTLLLICFYGLGAQYGAFRSATSMRTEPLGPDELLGLLLQEEQRLEDDVQLLSPATAHTVSTGRSRPFNRSSGGRPPPTDQSAPHRPPSGSSLGGERQCPQCQFIMMFGSFTDWGGDYMNVSTLLESKGIAHRVSYPYTPAQNGSFECCNQTILTPLYHNNSRNKYFTQVFSSPTEHRLLFWVTNLHLNVYIINLLTMDFFKSFACLCYPFLHPYTQTKMDFLSLPCIFLGVYVSRFNLFDDICFHVPTSRVYVSMFRHLFPFPDHHYTSSNAPLCQQGLSVPLSLLQVAFESSLVVESSGGNLGVFGSSSESCLPSSSPLLPPFASASSPPTTSPPESGSLSVSSFNIASSPSVPSLSLTPLAITYPAAPTWFRPPNNSSHTMPENSVLIHPTLLNSTLEPSLEPSEEPSLEPSLELSSERVLELSPSSSVSLEPSASLSDPLSSLFIPSSWDLLLGVPSCDIVCWFAWCCMQMEVERAIEIGG
ncbi:hypothetical protein V2J09_018427 [Rumex salicifolius]